MKNKHTPLAWLVGTVLLVGLGLGFTFWSYRQIEDTTTLRKEVRNTISAANTLHIALTDAETGQRGYALTGNISYLEPYTAVNEGLPAQLDALRQLPAIAPDARAHLDALVPLLTQKRQEMADSIALRQNHNMAAVLAQASNGQGKEWMAAMRTELAAFTQLQNLRMAETDMALAVCMQRLYAIFVSFGLLAFGFALYLSYSMYRRSLQQEQDIGHQATQAELHAQTSSNIRLQEANRALRESEQKLSITLHSIGDGVIVTDAQARITLINTVAEKLTGWLEGEALGRPIDEVFHILSKGTRKPAVVPILKTLERGTVQGLANHTILVSKTAQESDIADSCAPIRDADNQVVGAVLVFRNVTAEYAAQSALRESEERLNFTQHITHTGGWNLNLVDLSSQRTLEHDLIFGYKELLPNWTFDTFISHVLEQDRAQVELSFKSATAAGSNWSTECRIRRVDGVVRHVSIAGQHQALALGGVPHMAGIVQDITDRRSAQEGQRKSDARLGSIVSSVLDAVVSVDIQNRITLFNSAAEDMFGIRMQDALGSSLDRLIPERYRQSHHEHMTDYGAHQVTKSVMGTPGELYGLHSDGREFPIEASIAQVDLHGEKIFTVIMRDVSERRVLDQTLHETNIALQRAKMDADKANLAKSEFLSNMSHELRSPLNAILGFAQLMETATPAPTPTQLASIGQILRAGWYLLELINEVLDLALIESGRISLNMESVDLHEVLLDCETMLEPLARKRGIQMHFPPHDGEVCVEADRIRLKQVLLNLLANAIKYNRDEGTVHVALGTSSADPSPRLRITVLDTGEGLAAGKLAQLFQPFNRLGRETRDEEGTGIGLAVSKRLVDLMGGDIGALSTIGVGSTFWLELPLTTPLPAHASAPIPLQVDTHATAAEAPTKLLTLLYVEDNPANMALVEQLVSRRPGLRLMGANDGLRGISMARKHMPDVILMDINLPGISGLQALKILREDPSTQHIPVLALSANAMPTDIARGLEAGFYVYLTKPIKLEEFMPALDAGLALAHAHAKALASQA